MIATNLVDLAREMYPQQVVCTCGCVIRPVDVRWVDGAGRSECPGGGLHAPRRLR